MSKRPLPPFLKVWFDTRTGRRYAQFRKRGHKLMPLPWPPGTEEFWNAYNAAMAATTNNIGADLRSLPGSISAALAAYYASSEWDGLSDGTRNKRRLLLEKLRERYGRWPLRQLNENFLTAYLAAFKGHAARNHLKALRGFLRHAKHDVTRAIVAPKATSKRHASWPAEVIAQYEAHHAIGTKARLAFALARFTGAACAEIARLGPQHIAGDEISIARQKTGVHATIIMHPELRAIIEATPLMGLTTFLVTMGGKRFSPNFLSDQFRKWCDQAGVPAQYHLHGLRHTMGKTLAEGGASPNEVGAVLGHSDMRSALHYTKDAERKVLARTAMARVIKTRTPR